ncbi:hypothetical protein NKR19_g4191 [Coniochaeta hoffmannii]|uniref:Protein kinase domain-containing protein n=1 Tax=Coniochaeta hoffmannii TaxID=91930 RepID=A0AA38VWU2_9PEZI|nr:hypothetical protein NKR19_g4191 [Coniochaeta hoffmannii]
MSLPAMNQPVDVREAEERLRNLRAIHARIDYQKTHTDYFDLWRAGDGRAFQYDKQLRQVVISYLVFPRPGRWPGHGASVAQGRRTRPYRIQKLRTSDGPQSNRRLADKVAERMEQMLAFGGLRITKILGWGGQGIACAVEGEKANGEPIKLVCKASLGSKGIHEEKLNHILMAGAKHVVQRVVLADRPEEKETAHGQSRETMDLDETLFFIEFMRRGDLKGILNKAAVRKTPFPNRVLWQILDCLFAGVVAMAFPNKWHDPRADPISEQMPQRREVPTGQWDLNATEETMVHFDLDPLNVLVGDFDDGEHSTAPVVKIADLGLARVVDLDFRLDWEDMWGARRCGKVDIFTPEQFAEEWDWINYVPYMHHDAMEKETAGNYHWWTNMYQVAQIMWQLITLCHLEWPPVLEEYWDTHPDGSVKRSWTYGGALLRDEFIHVDMDLRWLIAQCMSHSPFDRPSMGDIDWAIQRHFDRPGPSADERLAVRSFWEAMDGDPSPPAASQPANLAGVAAAAAKAQAMRPDSLLRPGQGDDHRGQPLTFILPDGLRFNALDGLRRLSRKERPLKLSLSRSYRPDKLKLNPRDNAQTHTQWEGDRRHDQRLSDGAHSLELRQRGGDHRRQAELNLIENGQGNGVPFDGGRSDGSNDNIAGSTWQTGHGIPPTERLYFRMQGKQKKHRITGCD